MAQSIEIEQQRIHKYLPLRLGLKLISWEKLSDYNKKIYVPKVILTSIDKLKGEYIVHQDGKPVTPLIEFQVNKSIPLWFRSIQSPVWKLNKAWEKVPDGIFSSDLGTHGVSPVNIYQNIRYLNNNKVPENNKFHMNFLSSMKFISSQEDCDDFFDI